MYETETEMRVQEFSPIDVYTLEEKNTGGYEPEKIEEYQFSMWCKIYDVRREDLDNELGLGIEDSLKLFGALDERLKNNHLIKINGREKLYEVKLIEPDYNFNVQMTVLVKGVRP